MRNFCTISQKSVEMLNLNVGEMVELLSADDLNAKNEEHVFETAIRWIDHDPENRKQNITELLKSVRLGLLTTQYFVEKVKVRPA